MTYSAVISEIYFKQGKGKYLFLIYFKQGKGKYLFLMIEMDRNRNYITKMDQFGTRN